MVTHIMQRWSRWAKVDFAATIVAAVVPARRSLASFGRGCRFGRPGLSPLARWPCSKDVVVALHVQIMKGRIMKTDSQLKKDVVNELGW